VASTLEPPGPNCANGGYKLVSAGPKTDYICNGQNGANGQTGFTETLPPGKTEKGMWAASVTKADTVSETGFFGAPVSFSIPLASPLSNSHVHYSSEVGFAGTCTGSVANPTAPSGELCVYLSASGLENAEFEEIESSSTAGVILIFEIVDDSKSATPYGSWAVTG
jgi:hypothetical protein